MAKKNQSSKRKVAVFSVKGWDAAHYKTTDQYAKAVERIMVATTTEISGMVAKRDIDTNKPFKFSDYPAIQKEVNRAVADMAKSMTVTIERGSRKEWLSASQKNDAFIQSVMNTSKVSKARLSKMQDKNLDALAAFQSRKVEGMDLSQRVWKYAGQFKDQIEQCIDVGLGEGRSADELSRDVRQNLKDPNRLFRRVRDKRGNLVLSKNARAFHPGQGVYRSSYKNAMRLTRSEINMAYRESDYLRWQQLDFVIGIEIHRSNHDPLCDCDLCARLVGKYPKTFKFKGWHPQCMCYATPVLVSDDEFDAQELSDLKSALHGTEYRKLAVKGEITDVPDGFKDWVKENTEKQKGWSSTPYFIKDNFVDGELAKGLKPAALGSSRVGTTTQNEPVVEPAKPVPFDELDNMAQGEWLAFINDKYPLDWDMKNALRRYGIGYEDYENHVKDAKFGNEYWRKDELLAEYNGLMAKLNNKIAAAKDRATQLVNEFETASGEYVKWLGVDETTKYVQRGRDFIIQQDMRMRNFDKDYNRIIDAFTTGAYSIDRMRANAASVETRYNNAITKAKDAIAKYSKDVDVTKLNALVNEPLSATRPAVNLINEINAELMNVERAANGMQTIVNDAAARGIEKNDVAMHKTQPTEQEMIDNIGGGDKTSGSCSSLAFTWAANRGGMDVLDFRGGKSCDFFARNNNISAIVETAGGIAEYMSGLDAMKKMEIGKEYYLGAGRHASIVRRTGAKSWEYLELQSGRPGQNGWHPLDNKVLGWRFSSRGRDYNQLCEVEKLFKSKGFKDLMGFINTAKSDQSKGESGTIK